MADYKTIELSVKDGAAILTLNRPDRLNSFTAEMHEEMQAALTVIETDPAIRALLLTGAGRGFCAGQDLNLSLIHIPSPRDQRGSRMPSSA